MTAVALAFAIVTICQLNNVLLAPTVHFNETLMLWFVFGLITSKLFEVASKKGQLKTVVTLGKNKMVVCDLGQHYP